MTLFSWLGVTIADDGSDLSELLGAIVSYTVLSFKVFSGASHCNRGCCVRTTLLHHKDYWEFFS
jgi:hypothetical protein